MTGKSHLAANGAICLAAGADPVVATIAILCARVPDQAEAFLPGVKHRTLTHHLYFWAGMCAFFFLFPTQVFLPGVDAAFGKVLLGFFLGGMLHVVMDMFSKSGVPIYPGRVWGARIYTTGSYSEYLFLSFLLLSCGGIFFALNPSYLYYFKESLGV